MEMLYTVAEVAKILKVNKNMVYRLIQIQKLKAIKFGTFKITHKELENFLEEYNGVDLSNEIKGVICT